MSLTKCSNCGCEDSFLTSPAPCPTPAACPDPEPCYQIIDANCVIYSGIDIDCNNDTVVAQDSSVADALNDLNNYYCTQIATLTGNITNLQNAQTAKLRYVQEFTSNLDGATLSILRSDLLACGIDPSLCSEDGSEFSDFVLSIWYLSGTNWVLLQPFSPAGSWGASVDNVTGNIQITTNMAPIDPDVRVRVVLLF